MLDGTALNGSYWFFYGGDKLGNWIEASVHYTQSRPLIAASYAVPTMALLAAAFIRWRHRFFFAVLMVVGVAIAGVTESMRRVERRLGQSEARFKGL